MLLQIQQNVKSTLFQFGSSNSKIKFMETSELSLCVKKTLKDLKKAFLLFLSCNICGSHTNLQTLFIP